MNQAELDALDDPDGPNEPTAMVDHQGSHAVVPVLEQRKRRGMMSGMLAQGAASDQIVAAFAGKFQMTEHATRGLITEVRAMWAEDDAESLRYERPAQKRRLLNHIREAAQGKKWTAVANLESTYSSVAGTDIHEDDTPVDIDSRLSEAILLVLGETNTKDIRIMIEKERTFIELSRGDGLPDAVPKPLPGETIVVEGV